VGQIWFAPRLVLLKRLFESRIISVMNVSMLRILLVLFSAPIATAQGGSYPKPQISSAKGQQPPDFTLQDQDGLCLAKTSYTCKMNALAKKLNSDSSDIILAMIVSLRHLLGWIVSSFRSREDLVLENLALRRQLLALHAQRPRTRLTALHKLFWVALRMFWSGWRWILRSCIAM